MSFQTGEAINVPTTTAISALRTLGAGPGGLFSGYSDGQQAMDLSTGYMYILTPSTAPVSATVLATRDDSTRRWILNAASAAGVNTIASAGGTIVVTNGGGPNANVEVFQANTVPPAVASAGVVGTSARSARQDHTHALDIVPYPPSLVGMQASGVLQQTYAAPTATPSVLTMVAGQVPYGHATAGTLTQSAGLMYSETATIATLNLQGANAGVLRLICGTTPGVNTSAINFRNGVSAINYVAFAGTPGSAGTKNTLRITLTPLAGGDTTDKFDWVVNGIGQSVAGVWMNAVGLDFWAGSNSLIATGGTGGFVWLPNIAGTPTGVPALAASDQGSGVRNPVVIASSQKRFWWRDQTGSSGWHYFAFNDYAATATRIPFGDTTSPAQTDSANLTYTVGTGVLQSPAVETNTVGGFGGGNVLTLENNHVTPLSSINLTSTDIQITVPAVSGLVPTAANTSIGTAGSVWGGAFIGSIHASAILALTVGGLDIQGNGGSVCLHIDDDEVSFTPAIGLQAETAAAAQVMTLTNGPTATGGGDPDKWFQVLKAGTTYVIPAWAV